MSWYSSLNARIANWSQRRHGMDAAPLTIGSRRVYILPTRFGLMYAVVVVAMGLGGMNYGNNLALLLAFLLASLGFVTMHHCQRNLVGLTLHTLGNAPVFAGQLAHINVRIDNPSHETRLQLLAEVPASSKNKTTADLIDTDTQIDPHDTQNCAIALPTTRRGWLTLPRLVISTRYPFGLFRAWTVLHLPLQCMVYPRPSEPGITPPPMAYDPRDAANLQRGDEEFAGFRNWQPGDSPARIAWKQYARSDELLLQQHAGAARGTHLFDWDMLTGLNVEARLSRLTRWIVDAHETGDQFGLKMPGFDAAPDAGDAHLHRCLSALALFQADES